MHLYTIMKKITPLFFIINRHLATIVDNTTAQFVYCKLLNITYDINSINEISNDPNFIYFNKNLHDLFSSLQHYIGYLYNKFVDDFIDLLYKCGHTIDESDKHTSLADKLNDGYNFVITQQNYQTYKESIEITKQILVDITYLISRQLGDINTYLYNFLSDYTDGNRANAVLSDTIGNWDNLLFHESLHNIFDPISLFFQYLCDNFYQNPNFNKSKLKKADYEFKSNCINYFNNLININFGLIKKNYKINNGEPTTRIKFCTRDLLKVDPVYARKIKLDKAYYELIKRGNLPYISREDYESYQDS